MIYGPKGPLYHTVRLKKRIIMKAYGNTKDFEVNEYGYCQVSEIAISASPEQLKELSSFLLQAAKEMESMGKDYDHIHLQDISSKWDESWVDFIVSKDD